jgi:hypothetical protein
MDLARGTAAWWTRVLAIVASLPRANHFAACCSRVARPQRGRGAGHRGGAPAGRWCVD